LSTKEAWESHKEAARDAIVTETRAKFLEAEEQLKRMHKRIDELQIENNKLKIELGALTERMDKMSEWAKAQTKGK